MSSPRSLTGKTALITGSTSGIGLGIARALAGQGANIVLNGLGPKDHMLRLRDQLAEETQTSVSYDAADVSQPAQVKQLVEAAEATYSAVDILINNAGIQFVARVEEFPEDKWENIQSVVLDSAFHATKAAVPGMRRRDWGRIINLASVHGLVASPYKSAYVAAKHGMIGLTRSVALELAESAVTCNAVCPGYVRTALVEQQIDRQAEIRGMPRERVIKEVILAAQPSRRFVEVEEVAGLCLYLCGDLARSINGAAIAIDGGWTAA